MSYTLYTAPNCLRCAVVKNYLAKTGTPYEAFDFQGDKDIFNAFYRANRPSIYRNPEGVEFPILSVVEDGQVKLVKQGSGEVIAYFLSGRVLESCVTRSDLLHGWISGLYPSDCPKDQDDNFISLIRYLGDGGLKVYLQVDGRRPDLLEKILASCKVSRLVLDVPGPASVYPKAARNPQVALEPDDLKKTIALVRNHPSHLMRLYLKPIGDAYITPEEAGEAAKMLFDASGDIKLPVFIYISDESAEGVAKLEASALFPYRGKMRNHLVAVDMAKPEDLG